MTSDNDARKKLSAAETVVLPHGLPEELKAAVEARSKQNLAQTQILWGPHESSPSLPAEVLPRSVTSAIIRELAARDHGKTQVVQMTTLPLPAAETREDEPVEIPRILRPKYVGAALAACGVLLGIAVTCRSPRRASQRSAPVHRSPKLRLSGPLRRPRSRARPGTHPPPQRPPAASERPWTH